MTTDSRRCCCRIASPCEVCRGFFLLLLLFSPLCLFSPTVTAKKKKNLPPQWHTRVPTYSLPFHPPVMSLPGQTNAHWNDDPTAFLPHNAALSLELPLSGLAHTHMRNLLLHHLPPLHKCNPELWSAARKVSFAWENQAASFNIIMLPNYMVLIGNRLITLAGRWKASVWP